MKTSVIFVYALLCLSPFRGSAQLLRTPHDIQSQAPGSPWQETVVRNAYAKVTFLTELTAYSKAAIQPESNKAITAASMAATVKSDVVTYDLSDFKTGVIDEIADIPWRDMITTPAASERTVRVSVNLQEWKDVRTPQSSWKIAEVAWGKPSSASDEAREQVLSMPVRKILELGGKLFTYPDVVYDSYTTYQVTITYQGQRVGPYKALFFFGKNAKGQNFAAPQDPYSDVASLYKATAESFYPSGILHTHLREKPLIANWLNATQMPQQSCAVNGADLCCSASRCGIANADLQRELSTPVVYSEQDSPKQ